MDRVVFDDSLDFLKDEFSRSVDLVYIDPPFNTHGHVRRVSYRIEKEDEERHPTLYKGIGTKTFKCYEDNFGSHENYIEFLMVRLEEIQRVLKNTGSLLIHLDHREVHYIKVLLDQMFGEENFRNEIILHWDYGARAKKTWPKKHQNVLWYTMSSKYTFNLDASYRIPYMAPALQKPERAARGKTPTDCHWCSIEGTNSKNRTGYPHQKPIKFVKNLVAVHSNKGDHVMDVFAGSGTAGVAALELGRRFTLVDNNEQAIDVMEKRFKGHKYILKVNKRYNSFGHESLQNVVEGV
jgi:site-specific DNA-methyltransferase (adenine-specific)